MSSPNPSFSKDDLDRAVKGALRARVSGQEPPERAWKRIRAELESNKPPARRPRTSWSPLLTQAALTLMLAVLGGLGSQLLLYPESRLDNAPNTVVPAVTLVYVQEEVTSPRVEVISDEADIRLLRKLPKSGPGPLVVARVSSRPPLFVPRDVPPSVFSPQGRMRRSQLSSPFVGEEQARLVPGPYPWSR
jgi:hypothetical protein